MSCTIPEFGTRLERRKKSEWVRVREYDASDRAEWDEFVFRHPHGSPFHQIAWRDSIADTFAYQPLYLLAQRGRSIAGVLPLFLVENILTRRALISSPFAVYGGILAADDEVRSALAEKVRDLAVALGVEYLELRNAYPEQCAGFTHVDRYVTFAQDIVDDEATLLGGIPRKTRAVIRKALTLPFRLRQTRDLTQFERLYSANLRRLGTPAFPSRHFATLLRNFGNQADVRETVLDGKVAASVLSFYFRDQILPYYGAADPAYNPQGASSFMYFDLMRWGGENGYKLFDFGRSKKESGSFGFKDHWGMLRRELPYEVLLVKRKTLPNYSPQNAKFQLAIRLWKKLPLALTRALGPYLVRLVP